MSVTGFLLGFALASMHQAAPPAAGEVTATWGGQVKAQGFVSRAKSGSLFEPVGTGTLFDGNVQFRLKNDLFFSEETYFTTHYEAVLSGGDTRRKVNTLDRLFPGIARVIVPAGRTLEDDRRFFDLTGTVDDDEGHALYHRLDRLFLGLQPGWGSLRIGRQAVTWGNGLLFNPFDLVNPFSPTDIERDYKVGDDMLNLRFPAGSRGELQLLYVQRRDPSTGDPVWPQSSLAGKLHFPRGTTELDLMAAKHYRDTVVGIGSTGYLGDAAWRLDGTWTFLRENRGNDDYLSLVANVDYSWVWGEKNFYGFIEIYLNGLGDRRYAEAVVDPDIRERVERGELFVLGRAYLSGHVTVELHPLFNLFLTVINNLDDPSGIVQPRAVWDLAEDVQLTVGGNVAYGERGTEFGGFDLAGSGLFTEPPDSAYVWITYYF